MRRGRWLAALVLVGIGLILGLKPILLTTKEQAVAKVHAPAAVEFYLRPAIPLRDGELLCTKREGDPTWRSWSAIGSGGR